MSTEPLNPRLVLLPQLLELELRLLAELLEFADRQLDGTDRAEFLEVAWQFARRSNAAIARFAMGSDFEQKWLAE